MNLLTKSRVQSYRACPRLHKLRYEEGYRPVREAEVLRFGSLFHGALEPWWLAAAEGADGPERFEAARSALVGEADPYDRAKAEALLYGYTVQWATYPCTVLGVEVEFRCPVLNPSTGAASRTWGLGGKIDALIRDADGRVLIVEHKTSSEDISVASSYWRRLRMDGQISAYYQGARALGHDVWGCLYDVIRKPGEKPLKANTRRAVDETPDEYRMRIVKAIDEDPARYFQRGEVVRLESDMEEHSFDLWQTARSIRESELAARWPRNPDACTRWGRECEFLSVCTGEADIHDPLLFRRVENVHQELQQPKEEATHGSTGDEASPAK